MDIQDANDLNQILIKTKQRLNFILEYYQKKGPLKKENEYYNQDSIIILLTLREIEIIKDKLETNETNKIKIPQLILELKKIYYPSFNNINYNSNIISDFKNSIINIGEELKNLINIGEITENYRVSVIDDLIIPDNNYDYLFNIIESAYNCNFHKFYLNYIKKFIRLISNENNIYTKDVLDDLIMVKYITQILIFIKIYIRHRLVKKEKLSEKEYLEIKRNINFIDDIVMTNFILDEVGNIRKKDKCYLIKDNEKALDELINFNHIILKIIRKVEKNMNNNNNI